MSAKGELCTSWNFPDERSVYISEVGGQIFIDDDCCEGMPYDSDWILTASTIEICDGCRAKANICPAKGLAERLKQR